MHRKLFVECANPPHTRHILLNLIDTRYHLTNSVCIPLVKDFGEDSHTRRSYPACLSEQTFPTERSTEFDSTP